MHTRRRQGQAELRPVIRARLRIEKDASNRPDAVRIQSDIQLRAHSKQLRITELSAVLVSRQIALEICRAHGMPDPSPMIYELDHLVPLDLGGVTATHSLKPQPYRRPASNVSDKDALEDRLMQLIC